MIQLRPYQQEVITKAVDTLRSGTGVIISSPTGTGKTIMGLKIAEQFGITNVYVRTKNQYSAWERDSRNLGMLFTGRAGKDNFCLFEAGSKTVCDVCGTPKEEHDTKVKKGDHKPKWIREYYAPSCAKCIHKEDTGESSMLQQLGIINYGSEMQKKNLCMYHWLKKVPAKLFIYSYIYYFYKLAPEAPLICFDEAHNLEMTELMSTTVTLRDLEEELGEMVKEDTENEFEKEYVQELLDNRFKKAQLQTEFIEFLNYGKIPENLFSILPDRSALRTKIEKVLEATNQPDLWFVEKDGFRIKIILKDPSVILSTLNDKKFILLSGTMFKEDYLKNVWGLKNFKYIDVAEEYYDQIKGFMNLEYSVCNDFSTRFETRTTESYQQIANGLAKVNTSDGIHLVMLPSYDYLSHIRNYLSDKSIVYESSTSKLETLNNMETGTVIGVAGGKFTEGIERVNDGKSLIKYVTVVGMPFGDTKDTYTKAVIETVARRLGIEAGKPFEDFKWMIMQEKACIKTKQAIGRAIRSDKDTAKIRLVDFRFKMQNTITRIIPKPVFKSGKVLVRGIDKIFE